MPELKKVTLNNQNYDVADTDARDRVTTLEGYFTDKSTQLATDSAHGFMSSTDKTKLDGLTPYTLPTASTTELGGVKVGTNLSIDTDGVLSATDTTYAEATTTTAGLMSAADKTTLNGLDPSTLVHTTGDETIAGTKTFSTAIAGDITGNAATATTATEASKLSTARTITIAGSASTTATFDGSSDITIYAYVKKATQFCMTEAYTSLGYLESNPSLDCSKYSVFQFRLGVDGLIISPYITENGAKTITLVIQADGHSVTWDTTKIWYWPDGVEPDLSSPITVVTLLNTDGTGLTWYGVSAKMSTTI